MKIATFNANSIRSRLGIILVWLDEHKPDVLCIQETKAQDKDFPINEITSAGYNCTFKGQKSYNGVCIISPHKIENVEIGLDDEPKDESRIIKACINGINIVNTYVPQGREMESEHFQYKLEWFKRLKKYFDKRFTPESNVIWLGDLNVAPEDIDIHDPIGLRGHVCFNEQVTAALYDTMDWGFVDLFRLHNKDAGQYTFWDYRAFGSIKRNIGWRIDHIMATKPLAQKCTSCYVDKIPRMLPQPSDHTFLIAELYPVGFANRH
jgi:exodeoxyribonuclease-3